MDTIFQFCTMWQNLFTNARSITEWTEMDLEHIIEWAQCCEKAVTEELKLTDESATEEDLANFNTAVVEQFMYLPPSFNYVNELANSSHNIVKTLIQNPYLPDKLLNHLIKILAKNDQSLADSVAISVEECVSEKNLIEMLLSHEAFKEAEPENLAFKAKATILAKRLLCIWTLLSPPSESSKKFVVKNCEESSREKAVKSVISEHLNPASSMTCLYLLREVAPIDGLREIVYNETLAHQQMSFDSGPESDGILADISAKYPGFFSAYLFYILRRLHQVEGSALDDENANALLEQIERKLGALARKTNSHIYGAVRRLLMERRDRQLCERRDIYDRLLLTIFCE